MTTDASSITFTSARVFSLRDSYLLDQINLRQPTQVQPAVVELMLRWVDPPRTISDLWEIPDHVMLSVLERLYAAINESRRVTALLQSALANLEAVERAVSPGGQDAVDSSTAD